MKNEGIFKSPDALKLRFSENPCGAFLLCGEEDFLIDRWRENFRKKLDADFTEFDSVRVDFSDGGTLDILEGETGIPPMGAFRLIEVRSLPILKLTDKDEKRLCRILSAVSEQTAIVIIFSGGTLVPDKKTAARKIFKSLSETAFLVDFKKLTDARLLPWAGAYLKPLGAYCSDENMRLIFRRCDYSMLRIASELEKLSALARESADEAEKKSGAASRTIAPARKDITREMIAELTDEAPETEIYKFTDAVFKRDYSEAYRTLAVLTRMKSEPIVLCAALARANWTLAVAGEGGSPAEALRIGGIQDWQLRNYRVYLKNHSSRFCARAAEKIAECDTKLKYETADGYALLFVLTAELLRME